jgi:hypothetical protein
MEIVKKHWVSILCGVIALVALVAWQWPLGGMFAEAQADLNKRVDVYNGVSRLRKTPRYWPVIPKLASGKPTPLTPFPSDPYIKSGGEIKDEVHNQATGLDPTGKPIGMKEKTEAANRHELLVSDVLPMPHEKGFKFQQDYLEQVQKILPAMLVATAHPPAVAPPPLPPVEADVRAEADRLWKDEDSKKIYFVAGNEMNRPQVQAAWEKRCATLQNSLRLKRAQHIKLYLEPNALSVSTAMTRGGGVAPDARDIYYAQTMLWVQQDLVDAIVGINKSADDVMTAPIKHLFKLEVPEGITQFVLAGTGSDAGKSNDPAGKTYSRSPTGRVCNSVYDVIQFGLLMDVEASKLPLILAHLQQGKLITIQQVDLAAVDGIAMEDDGFIYGNVPMIRVTIRGEELLLRSWTNPPKDPKENRDRTLMPDEVKKDLSAAAS